MPFYENEGSYLKATGSLSSMNFIMRCIAPGLAGYTHLAFGQLVWNAPRTGLIAQYSPEVNPCSFLNIRQDISAGNTVDVTIFKQLPNNILKEIKKFSSHHQPPNTGSFYYTEFVVPNWTVQLAIGSGISMSDLFQNFEQRTLLRHF